ncbi:lipopolysaccharide-responsive and beige-like anchor protein [Tachysurus ichikawai]
MNVVVFLRRRVRAAPEDDVLKGQQLGKDRARTQSSESLTEGDDETISSLEEKELDSLTVKQGREQIYIHILYCL